MKIAGKLNLQYLVLGFDKSIYSKVQQIRWKTPEFKERFAVRLGDFHVAISFQSTIERDSERLDLRYTYANIAFIFKSLNAKCSRKFPIETFQLIEKGNILNYPPVGKQPIRPHHFLALNSTLID